MFKIKTVSAQSSFYENKVLHLMSAEEGFVKVPCFDKMKIVHNTVLKMNGL